jgi:hypothetical protein
MSQSEGNLVEIDTLGIEILKAIMAHDGTSDSTALREYLGLDGRSRFNYRIDEYLEPNGLVDTHQPDPKPGMYPPKEISITEAGKEYLEKVDEDGESRGVVERLERLEEQVDGLRRENQELREQNAELTEAIAESNVDMVVSRVPELEGDVDALQSKVGNLQDALGDLNSDPVVGNDFAPTAINTGFLLGNVARELLVEQVGEDRVAEVLDKKQAKLESDDKVLKTSN